MSDEITQYRKAADRIWEMAKEYRAKGYLALAATLRDLSSNLHDVAREKQLKKANLNGKD